MVGPSTQPIRPLLRRPDAPLGANLYQTQVAWQRGAAYKKHLAALHYIPNDPPPQRVNKQAVPPRRSGSKAGSSSLANRPQ